MLSKITGSQKLCSDILFEISKVMTPNARLNLALADKDLFESISRRMLRDVLFDANEETAFRPVKFAICTQNIDLLAKIHHLTAQTKRDLRFDWSKHFTVYDLFDVAWNWSGETGETLKFLLDEFPSHTYTSSIFDLWDPTMIEITEVSELESTSKPHETTPVTSYLCSGPVRLPTLPALLRLGANPNGLVDESKHGRKDPRRPLDELLNSYRWTHFYDDWYTLGKRMYMYFKALLDQGATTSRARYSCDTVRVLVERIWRILCPVARRVADPEGALCPLARRVIGPYRPVHCSTVVDEEGNAEEASDFHEEDDNEFGARIGSPSCCTHSCTSAARIAGGFWDVEQTGNAADLPMLFNALLVTNISPFDDLCDLVVDAAPAYQCVSPGKRGTELLIEILRQYPHLPSWYRFTRCERQKILRPKVLRDADLDLPEKEYDRQDG
ncbi:Uu.00g123570.m01.CDS01 [Anthostomella pinea]|uniref:Uu.00g123570.m01.CDS01 n=1 Tax=Anthostomella pinea TaxID=933095 RepID=A0AAI8YF39_9PEZI|nr:Uu.00g123570.m01.CDS01 [Anthostomella pinea]